MLFILTDTFFGHDAAVFNSRVYKYVWVCGWVRACVWVCVREYFLPFELLLIDTNGFETETPPAPHLLFPHWTKCVPVC